MRVLVLGGTGTISLGITEACLARGHEVIHLRRARTRAPDGVHTLAGDRDAPGSLAAAAALRPDVVIDMLCFRPEQAEAASAAFAGRCAQLVFCSTACVYDLRGRSGPLGEDAPVGAASAYGRDKAACERVFRAAEREGRFQVTIFRPSHVYRGAAVVHPLGLDGALALRRIQRGEPVLVLDGGRALWQACHGRDAGEAFAGACLNPRSAGRTYNLGLGDGTWLDYLAAMGQALGRAPRLASIDSRDLEAGGDRHDFALDIARHDFAVDASRLAADVPSFRQTVDLASGMREAWDRLGPGRDGPSRYDDRLEALLAARATPVGADGSPGGEPRAGRAG